MEAESSQQGRGNTWRVWHHESWSGKETEARGCGWLLRKAAEKPSHTRPKSEKASDAMKLDSLRERGMEAEEKSRTTYCGLWDDSWGQGEDTFLSPWEATPQRWGWPAVWVPGWAIPEDRCLESLSKGPPPWRKSRHKQGCSVSNGQQWLWQQARLMRFCFRQNNTVGKMVKPGANGTSWGCSNNSRHCNCGLEDRFQRIVWIILGILVWYQAGWGLSRI